MAVLSELSLKTGLPLTPRPHPPTTPMKNLLEAPPVMIGGSLDPYTGTWNEQTARHLLSRAMFAPNARQITEAVNDGMALTIEKLLSAQPTPDPPLNTNYQEDPNVPVGQTRINAPRSTHGQLPTAIYSCLAVWPGAE